MKQVSTPLCRHNYIFQCDGSNERIKSLLFDRPLPLDKAISEIHSDKEIISDLSVYKIYNDKTLNQIKSDISVNPKLQDIKVKGMIDYGQTAYVFETDGGDILKITSRDHFLGRKETEFDNPIKMNPKPSKKSFCHYYLEEKVSLNHTEEERDTLIKRIQKSGYKITDCRSDQFGKTKDGRIVVIDPECIRKKGIFGLLRQNYSKIKSFAKIVLK